MDIDKEERSERAAKYRLIADRIRMLAGRIPYVFRSRAQLHALADGFERLADRVDGPEVAQN